jgi:hypothetical protein
MRISIPVAVDVLIRPGGAGRRTSEGDGLRPNCGCCYNYGKAPAGKWFLMSRSSTTPIYLDQAESWRT